MYVAYLFEAPENIWGIGITRVDDKEIKWYHPDMRKIQTLFRVIDKLEGSKFEVRNILDTYDESDFPNGLGLRDKVTGLEDRTGFPFVHMHMGNLGRSS